MNDPRTDGFRSAKCNLLKRRALEIFQLYGPLNPPAWAAIAKMHPVRSAYSYLLRLHRFGLLNRERDFRGLLIYSLSQRGRERLSWLSIPNHPKPSQTRPTEVTSGATIPDASTRIHS